MLGIPYQFLFESFFLFVELIITTELIGFNNLDPYRNIAQYALSLAQRSELNWLIAYRSPSSLLYWIIRRCIRIEIRAHPRPAR